MPTPAPAASATRTPPGSSLVPGYGSSGPAGTPASHMTPTPTSPNSALPSPDLTQGTEALHRPRDLPPAHKPATHGSSRLPEIGGINHGSPRVVRRSVATQTLSPTTDAPGPRLGSGAQRPRLGGRDEGPILGGEAQTRIRASSLAQLVILLSF